MPFHTSVARAAKSIENTCRTPRPKHLIGFAGLTLAGFLCAGASAHDLGRERDQPVTFGTKIDTPTTINKGGATLTAAHNNALSPGYRALDPIPVVKRIGHSMFGSELAIGVLGCSIALGAAGLRLNGANLQSNRAAAQAELQAKINRTTLRDPALYKDHNVDTMHAILAGPEPTLSPEEQAARAEGTYAGLTQRMGLDPREPVAHIVIAQLKRELELPAWPAPAPLPSWPSVQV